MLPEPPEQDVGGLSFSSSILLQQLPTKDSVSNCNDYSIQAGKKPDKYVPG
jgi:hypothetical protein